MKDMNQQIILVYMPNRCSPTAQSDVRRMKLIAPQVKLAFKEALHGDIYNAMTLNGLLHCASLGFNPATALDALQGKQMQLAFLERVRHLLQLHLKKVLIILWMHGALSPDNIRRTEVENEGTRVIYSG